MTWWTLVDIGEGNGSLAYVAKPLQEPIMTNKYWGVVVLTWGQLHRKCSRYLSLIRVSKLLIHYTAAYLRGQCQCQSALPFWDRAISKIDHENPRSRSCVRSKVKVTFDLQNSKVKVMFKVKHIGHIWGLEFNRYVCFLFLGNRTTFGWDIGNSILWPWKFKVNVMAKVKPDGHIWGLEFNRYVYFSFRGNRTIFWLRYSKFHIWPWKI